MQKKSKKNSKYGIETRALIVSVTVLEKLNNKNLNKYKRVTEVK